MKLKRTLIACLLILGMLFSLNNMAFASSEMENNTLNESRTIAINSPSMLGYDGIWEVVQTTELYNLSDEIVGFCFDMINILKDSEGPETTYVIVNSDERGFPILLFGAYGTSAYLGQDYDKAYYFGTLDFYVAVDEDIVNAHTGKELSSADIDIFSSSQVQTRSANEDYSALRQRYLNGITPFSPPNDTGSVSNGANLQWRKGCAPTAVAMLIKTKNSSLSGNTLIDSLASYMGTNSSGSTDFDKITSGTNDYFKNNTNLTKPKTCGWNSVDSKGSPRTGSSYNSTSTFKTSIDAGYPVGVYCSSSDVKTKGYPNGIGAHMMSGIGYSFGSNGDFVTCYTTNTADGEVSFPLTSTGLKNHAWFLLKW
ncbi:hypothetical protein GCM10023142_36070 [Anaerocolumna aminovalerica]|uniref:Peptidase_C39 like family protein n=1 Tax=Anaerocolumna aminovalerica TaxID=1527 RepID=A0A1I5ILG3_9FIRM|nr:C39 family peptidase [Anaerocolumna aminovalerica]MBU5334310.1 C39 family peptidase [Anaerocolumna aminovalerica]MDU6266759.1 C39 family peptidase [Anaerocolumna aminovalerica]SFO61179.1 Peptidase_C39 like family protein [Anaerocolumna aminovalerica]